MNVGDGDAESAVSLDAIAGDLLRFVGGIVEHLDVEQFARVIELRDGLDEALDHVALVVDRELNCDLRPFRDFRRRSGNIFAILEVIVDQVVAMNSVHRQNYHHQEIRNHDGEIERVGLVEPAKSWIDQMPPIGVERIARQRHAHRQIVGRHQGVSTLLTAGQPRLYGGRRRCQRFVSDRCDLNFRWGAAQLLEWPTGSRLRQSHAGLRAGFEHGEQVGETEKIPNRFVVVDQDQLAAALFRRDVEADDGAEAGAIHAGEFLEIEDDSASGRKQSTDMVLQCCRVFHGQAAFALNDHGVVPRPRF